MGLLCQQLLLQVRIDMEWNSKTQDTNSGNRISKKRLPRRRVDGKSSESVQYTTSICQVKVEI